MRRLSVAVVVALGALVFAGSAQACSCAPLGPDSALRRADAAIVAELVEVVPRDGDWADYRYRVRHVYKPAPGMAPGALVSVRSPRDGAACALPTATARNYGLLLSEVRVRPLTGAQRKPRAERRWVGGLCGVVAPRALRSLVSRSGANGRPGSAGGPASCAS